MPTLEELLGAGPSGGTINSPGDAPNPFGGAGGDGAPARPSQTSLTIDVSGDRATVSMTGPDGKPLIGSANRPLSEVGAMISAAVKGKDIDLGDFEDQFQEAGLSFTFGTDADGNSFVATAPSGQEPKTPAGGTVTGGNTPSSPGGGQTTAQQEAARAQAAIDARAAGGGAAGGGGGGVDITRGAGGGADAAAASGGGGEFAGPGDQSIDPNAALGLDFGSAAGGIEGGRSDFVDPGAFGRPTPFTEGLGPDATLNDILLGAMGEQRAGRDLALGISGGLASGFEENELRRAAESGALDLVNNPFSLDDQTIARIQGQQGDLIGRNAERLQQASAARAASSGISRSGIQNAAQDRIDINAARQLGEAQRGLLVEQATRRPQEQAQALAAGSNVLGSQQQQRGQIARGAIDTLGNTSLSADAAVLGTLAAGGTPQVNIAGGGFKDSRENPASGFNPF
jgi:hypothetical protein